MKKRILSVLLVLVLVVGILPIGVSAAKNASIESSSGNLSMQYKNDGIYQRTITVNLFDPSEEQIDTLRVEDAILSSQEVIITIGSNLADKYDILRVDVFGADDVAWDQRTDSYSVRLSNIKKDGGATINIYLREETNLPDGEITEQGITRTYRIYVDQVYKMLWSIDNGITKSTKIDKITAQWYDPYTDGNHQFVREYMQDDDYFDTSFTSDNGQVYKAQPSNMKSISIKYKNGDEEKKAIIPASDLRFSIGGSSGSRHYSIELADDTFHIVYFYWDEHSDANNFDLYDFRFVEDGTCLTSANMPRNPEFLYQYAFVAWTEDFNGGRPFLETTPVMEDMSVYAQKTTTTSNRSEIHIMNNGNLFKERIAELYNVNVADIKWDELLVSVVASDGRATNPNYDLGSPDVPIGYEKNHWVNDDYFFVYNYLTGVGAQQNTSLHTTEMVKLQITATKNDGTSLGTVAISKGIYDGDFWPSVGDAAQITEIYINVNNTPNPDPEPSTYTVTFDLNYEGATGTPESQTINKGEKAREPEDPTRDGFNFEGWYTKAEGGEKFDFETTPIDADITLYAIWAVDQLGGGEDGDEPDQIPDYQQVFVKYVSEDPAMGSVEPSFEKFYVNGTIDLTGKATASTGYAFEKWTFEDATGDPGFPVSDSEKIDYTLKMPTGGTVYTFTAHFKVAKPAIPTAGDLAAIQNAILVKDSKASPINHGNQYFGLIEGCYEPAEDVTLGEDGQYTYQVTPIAAEYAKQYDADKSLVAGTHTSTVSQSNVDPVILLWNPANRSWSLQTPETIGVKCAPVDPDAGKTLKIYWAIDNPNAAEWKLYDGNARTETIAWSDRGNTFVMPEVVVEEGYHLAGWSVSGARDEYWDADDTQTFGLNGLIVEDDEGGYVSITANIVSDEPEDPDAGKTLKIYWAIDNPDAASWKLFANSSWTETIAWSDRGNTFVMPEVVVEKGYHLAGWSVSGARGEYWDADTQTFGLNGLIVEDDEGGYVSITANIVKDVPATYTVTLVNEGRYAYGEGSYKAGETVTVYAGTKVGYSFDKWISGDISITRPYSSKITFTMPAHNVVAKATWDRAGSILPSLPDVPDDTTPNWLNLDDHDAYIQGYPDGFVKPQNNITRAEVATIFFRLLTDEAREYFWSTDSGFSDVKSSDWFNNAVSTMVNAGVITGYNDGTFRPNDPITRAEFATIAARFLSDPYSLQDRFYDTEGHWAEVYINRAAEVGWINGYNDGSFRPDQAITRAEAVTLVNNVLGRKPHADYMLDNMITWPDNLKSAWYYEDIQEATNSHDYRWSSDKRYEIWTSLN